MPVEAEVVVADAAATAVAATHTPEQKAAADAAAAAAVTQKAAADAAVTQTPEQKAAAAAAATPASTAPEKYTDFTLPEGVTLDAKVIEAFSKTAKTLGLSQGNAQLVISEIAPVFKARGESAIAQVRADMLAASKADKDIGGGKFDTSVGLAKLAMEAHFSKEFNAFLNLTGLGNHPEMIRGLAKIGKPLAPDGWVPGSKDAQTKGDARSWYPNSLMNA